METKYAGAQAVGFGRAVNETRSRQLPDALDHQSRAISALVDTITQLENQLRPVREDEPERDTPTRAAELKTGPGKIALRIAYNNTEIQNVQQRMDALMNSLHV